jgi:hypothetical protein
VRCEVLKNNKNGVIFSPFCCHLHCLHESKCELARHCLSFYAWSITLP